MTAQAGHSSGAAHRSWRSVSPGGGCPPTTQRSRTFATGVKRAWWTHRWLRALGWHRGYAWGGRQPERIEDLTRGPPHKWTDFTAGGLQHKGLFEATPFGTCARSGLCGYGVDRRLPWTLYLQRDFGRLACLALVDWCTRREARPLITGSLVATTTTEAAGVSDVHVLSARVRVVPGAVDPKAV
jgi:hypothetical protein